MHASEAASGFAADVGSDRLGGAQGSDDFFFLSALSGWIFDSPAVRDRAR
jgi:hypothetical protein